MRKWTKYFISNCQLHNSSGDSFGLFRQLLTDDQHRVGQFGPSPLGRLMCGTCKFAFANAANSDLLPQGICICLFSYSTKISKQIIAKIQKNEDELRLNPLQRSVLQKHFESPDHFHDLPLRSQWYLFTTTLLTEISKLIKT